MDYVKVARDFKYRYGRGNLSLHTWNEIKQSFNPNLPIRPSRKWSPREFEDLQFDLQIFLSHYAALKSVAEDNPIAKEYLSLLNNWSEENNSSTVKEMKALEKSCRLSDEDFVIQSLISFHRAYDYYPSAESFNNDYEEYVTQYMSDEKFKPENITVFSRKTIIFLVNNFIRNSNKVEEYKIPSVSLSQSPIGDKKDDFKNISNILENFELPSEVSFNWTLINNACKELNIPEFKFKETSNKLSELSDVHINNVLLLVPKLSFIPNPGKLRPIFVSNDIYDVILDPFRKIVKLFSNNLSSSYNSKRVTSTDYLNVDIPNNVRLAYNNSMSQLGCSVVNSDLTSATDKIYSDFQNRLVLDLLNFVNKHRPEAIQRISSIFGIGDVINYVSICLKIISLSYINISYTKNFVEYKGLLRPKFGQCQGQRGSFDLLHLTHTAVCLESIFRCKEITLDPSNLPFLINGDDGVLPELVEREYTSIWVANSDKGIKSDEKSTQKSSTYVEFCKQFVRFDKNLRQPLNGLRFPTLAKLLSNPSLILQMEERYDTSDMWRQIKLLYRSINKSDIFLPLRESLAISIPDNLKPNLLKVRSLLLELLAKHAIKVSSVRQNVELIRSRIDENPSCFNVFDRERLLPDEDYSDAYDWIDRIGLISISNKFGLEVEGFYQFDIDREAYNCVVLGKTIPSYILSLALDTDIEIYKSLVSDYKVMGPKIYRRTSKLNIEWSIEPHSLLIRPEFIGSEIIFAN